MRTNDHTLEVIQKLMAVVKDLPSQDKARNYSETLVNLKQKYEDPEFRLAVIGNFSCGKSTFLNALLRRNMLTVDTQPTTAIPTYIRWNKSSITQYLVRMREEQRRKRTLWQKIVDFFRELFHKLPPIDQNPAEPYINVYGINHKQYLLYGNGVADFEADMGISLPHEINKMVDYLTTTNKLAAKIEKIELSFPERDGFQNFCLIDTPGVNPGDDAAQYHIVQTQSVLRKEADAAIVLYPAKDAMSKDLERFISENAAHLMGDAIVLLTKMDIVPSEKEQEKILNRTKQLVAQRFNQSEPVVYGISAFEALEYCSFNNTDTKSEKWFQNFNTVFSNVFSSLRERRNQIANKRIDYLLTDLMHTINTEISASTKQLQEERQSLLDCSMEKLETAYSELIREYHQRVNNAASGLHYDARMIVQDCIHDRREKMIKILDSSVSSSSLESRLWCEVPLQMADVNKAISEGISKTVLSRYTQMNCEIVQDVTDCLKKYKRHFGDISTRECVYPEKEFTLAASVFPYKKAFSENTRVALTVLLVFLTLGGYFLIMLIQWIADIFSFEKEKKAAIANMDARISDYEKKIVEELDKALKSIEQANIEWAKNLLADYKVAHHALFDETEQTFKVREEKLTLLICQNQSCLSRLTNLQQEYFGVQK